MEQVTNLQNEDIIRASELIQESKSIFDKLTLGVKALAVSHGTSTEGVEGYTDLPDASRSPHRRSIFKILPSVRAKNDQEKMRYRFLPWELSPLILANQSVPQKQIIRFTKDVSAEEIGLHSYELHLLDQGKQTEKDKPGSQFIALFDDKINEIQGLTISWRQGRNSDIGDKAFFDFLFQRSPQLANLVEQTMRRPSWSGIDEVIYNLQINLGQNGLNFILPSISFDREYMTETHSADGTVTTKHCMEHEEYIYNATKQVDQFVPAQGTKQGRVFSTKQYEEVLNEIKNIFPTELILS